MYDPNDFQDRWLTPAEAREFLGINHRTLNEWRRKQGLPAKRLGHRTLLYRTRALVAWVNKHENTRLHPRIANEPPPTEAARSMPTTPTPLERSGRRA